MFVFKIKKLLVVPILLFLINSNCFCKKEVVVGENVNLSNGPNKILAHPTVKDLSALNRIVLNKIIKKILQTDRQEYYFHMLNLLLSTPEASKGEREKLKQRNEEKMNESVKKSISASAKSKFAAKESSKKTGDNIAEELLELASLSCNWEKYRPNHRRAYYNVCRENSKNILIHVKVRPIGKKEHIRRVLLLEDAIEKHLSSPGFSVNLIFVGIGGDDVFDVTVNPSRWATSTNWVGSHYVLAHELMHLFGLPDEYDRIVSHANNSYLSFETRLNLFYHQIGIKVPEDSANGIMRFATRKPLQRHICAAVGLGNDCVITRKEKY